MDEELRFELETVSSRERGLEILGGFDNTLTVVYKILEMYPAFEVTNDTEKKQAKELRATFKKCIESIDRTRIDSIADYVATFTEQCNTIKALFEARRLEFDKAIKDYEASQKAVLGTATTVKKYTATIKFTDEKLIKKLTDFCEKNGCELVIK